MVIIPINNIKRTAAGVARATRQEPLLGVDNKVIYNTQLTFFLVEIFDEPETELSREVLVASSFNFTLYW